MQLSQIPARILAAFANAGNKRTIPVASQIGVTPGAASYTDGFPPLTFTPLNAGGVPPAGQDFNGIFNAITAVQQWQAGGGLFTYDAAWSTANGGYPKGALLLKADGSGYWRNLVDNNTVNPDTVGTNWVATASGGLVNVRRFTASTTYTPTPGTVAIRVTVQGGGGGGGASQATSAGQLAAASGGNSGAIAQSYLTSGFSGASIVVGVAGGGGNGGVGGTGGASSFGSISAPGGVGGAFGTAITPPSITAPNTNSAIASGGNLYNLSTGTGQPGLPISGSAAYSGTGASSGFGQGPSGRNTGGGGGVATNYGCGGAGALTAASSGAQLGGDGAAGVVIVEEFA